MTAPQRIQRKRTADWRMPEGAVYVGRPSRWGNPFRVVPVRRGGPFNIWYGAAFLEQLSDGHQARERAVERFRAAVDNERRDVPWPVDIRTDLVGRDLVCWCPLDQPCHADVLLEIANSEPSA